MSDLTINLLPRRQEGMRSSLGSAPCGVATSQLIDVKVTRAFV